LYTKLIQCLGYFNFINYTLHSTTPRFLPSFSCPIFFFPRNIATQYFINHALGFGTVKIVRFHSTTNRWDASNYRIHHQSCPILIYGQSVHRNHQLRLERGALYANQLLVVKRKVVAFSPKIMRTVLSDKQKMQVFD
jgi:hypothetical protein